MQPEYEFCFIGPRHISRSLNLSEAKTRRAGFENYTVFLKNSISFPRFGDQYTRKNMRHKGYCMYRHGDDDARYVAIKIG